MARLPLHRAVALAVALALALALSALADTLPSPPSVVSPPCPPASPCPPVPTADRYFAQTGFAVDQDAFWNYFLRRGGLPTFGYPVSRTTQFLGYPTQFFQRQVMQRWPDGSVHLLNLLDSGLMPYPTFNFSTFPAADPQLAAQAPNPSDPDYGTAALAFVRAHAPDSWNGLPVRFAQTYFGTVSPLAAFPNQPAASSQVQALLPLIQLEIWGLPTSAPAYDPTNHGFVYLRWQRGVMMYDASCNCTQGVLFADYFKAILMDRDLPVDLAQEAANSPYFAQYAPSQPNWVARPAQLPNTNLTDAFTPEPRPTTAGLECGHVQLGGPGPAVLNDGAAQQAEGCFWQAFQRCAAATLMATWMSVDTGVNRTFTIGQGNGGCAVTDVVQPYSVPSRGQPASTYSCSSVVQRSGGLVNTGCGADGDVVLPA